MKVKIFNEIEETAFFGTVFNEETKFFKDSNYFSLENLFKYKLSKIKFFLGEKNGKELILGLQTFYTTSNGKEIANEEYRDKNEKELNIKTLKIHPGDYICNFELRRGDDRITQIKFTTKKGIEFVVGSDEGEEMKVDFINDNKDFVILYLHGGYRKCLECISAGYIPVKSYIVDTLGYFELKMRVKDEKFKNNIQAKINEFTESDKVLFRVCSLENKLFNSIIKYCLF